jgi:hypothetical protein
MSRAGTCLAALLVLALAAAAVGSCGGDDYSDRNGGGGGNVEAGVADDDGSITAGCPDAPPKVGETCGPGTSESTTCEFNIGECTGPDGHNYVETAIYCCVLGVWESCGGRSPCDQFEAGAPSPVVDAGVSDAPRDGIDAMPDAP